MRKWHQAGRRALSVLRQIVTKREFVFMGQALVQAMFQGNITTLTYWWKNSSGFIEKPLWVFSNIDIIATTSIDTSLIVLDKDLVWLIKQ